MDSKQYSFSNYKKFITCHNNLPNIFILFDWDSSGDRKIHIQKLKLFRIRASLLAHSGSSDAAHNAALGNAHTSKANTERDGREWSAYALRVSGGTGW
jgi:hypothetical protein